MTPTRATPTLDARWDEVEGLRLHACAGGDGPPVVLVHGYGVSGRYMLPLAGALAGSCSVYVPDLPGHGRSDPPHGPLGIAELARALGDWLDVVGLERPVLLGSSMGCQVVTELAVRRPERAGPLVLVGPTIDPSRRSARRQIFGALRDSAHEPVPLVALAGREWAGGSLGQLRVLARSVLEDRIEERLPAIEQPAVVVHGEKDGVISPEWAQRAAALLPHGRLVVVPGEPHAVPYTRPGVLVEIVEGLLAEEREQGGGELVRSLPHGDVAAGETHESRPRQQPLPLVGHRRGHEPVPVAPDE